MNSSDVKEISRLGNESLTATPERREAIAKELKERFNVETLPSRPGQAYQPVAQNVHAWEMPRAT